MYSLVNVHILLLKFIYYNISRRYLSRTPAVIIKLNHPGTHSNTPLPGAIVHTKKFIEIGSAISEFLKYKNVNLERFEIIYTHFSQRTSTAEYIDLSGGFPE